METWLVVGVTLVLLAGLTALGVDLAPLLDALEELLDLVEPPVEVKPSES